MPGLTSRRRNRRQVSEEIEDEAATQMQIQDPVEDEEDQPRPPTKANAKAKRGPAIANETAQQENADDVIDIESLTDQPLDPADLKRFETMTKDWTLMATKLETTATKSACEVATSLAEVAEGEDGQKDLEELEAIMRDLIDVSNEMRSHEGSMNEMYQQLAQEEQIPDSIDRYREGANKRLAAYEAKTARQRYAKNENYKQFKQNIYEISHPGEAMPPITDFIPKEAGDDSDDDDELEVGGVTQDYKCPLTLTTLQNPVTSSLCGHSFSQSALRELLRNGTKKCPASGCNKMLKMADCKPNPELAKKVKLYERRQRRAQEDAEEDEDADEVID